MDASVVLAWFLDDEQGVPFEEAAASLAVDGAIVPPHWHYEVRNALIMAVRRDRLSRAGAEQRVQQIGQLSVVTDTSSELDAILSLAFDTV